MKKCSGCGVTLQFTNKEALGYIPEHKYKEANYCERCFKIIQSIKLCTHNQTKQIVS